MVKSLRIWGREPLRSAHRLFGFTINHLFRDPGRRLVAGPSRRPHSLQSPICLATPDSFWGRHITTVHHHRDPVAMRLITAAFSKGRGGGCSSLWRGRDGPGHFVGTPPHWISTGIRLVRQAEQLLFIGSGTEKNAHVVTPEIFVPNSGTTRASSNPSTAKEVFKTSGGRWTARKARPAHLDSRVALLSYLYSRPAKGLW